MVTKDYDGSKIAPKIEKGQIRITHEYLRSLTPTPEQEQLLQGALVGQSLCPRWYWFTDIPEVRAALGVKP